MRRFLTLVCVLCLTIPAGLSISGCVRNPAGKYCPNPGYDILQTAVYALTLQPQTGGISLAFGQTRQISQPSATTCTGAGAIVGANAYTYGTTNNQLVDISPTGEMCAGTWNRNTGGGIPNYTVCNFPNPLPTTGGLPYGSAYITASADSVTSNPVQVFVHAQVTSISLVGPQQCLSQQAVAQFDAQACYSGNGKQLLMCAPSSVTTSASPNLACPLPPGQALASIPSCGNSVGLFQFTVGNPNIGTINSVTNQITANQPGTTNITAFLAGSGSSAGYFSTCPPQSINVTLANGKTSGTISQSVQQNLTTSVIDTNGNPITGLALDYQSTNPIDIQVGYGGAVTTIYPGVASITAICQPSTCNPSPINETGLNGTGLSITSNPVTVTTPGTTSDYVWFGAPGTSQYFAPIELLTGTVGSTVRLPYVPNSMVMDQGGTTLYFGSQRELMEYNTGTNTLTKQDINAPGVVLAVAPNNSAILINDQIRQLFYLYYPGGGSATTFGGMGTAAQFTPDSKTLYITDSASANNPVAGITGHTDTLYVYSQNTGWSTYDLSASGGADNLAVTIPGVGAFLSGFPTVAHTWCPIGTVTNPSGSNPTSNITAFYPQGILPTDNSVNVQTDVLAATVDGQHILGAANIGGGGINLYDIGVTIPTTECPSTTTGTGASQVQTLDPLVIPTTLNQVSATGVTATAVNQVVIGAVPQAASSTTVAPGLAFITYNGNTPGAKLPYYLPAAAGAPGTLNYVTLMNGNSPSTTETAPLAGAFSPDNSLFFVSTAGDNQIHYISIPNSASGTPTDTKQISPNLPACTPVNTGGTDPGCLLTTPTSNPVPATVITVKPRSTT